MGRGRFALGCGVAAIAIGLGGALAARFDLVSKYAGFGLVMGGLLIALPGVALGLAGLFRRPRGRAIAGLLLSAGYAAVVIAPLAQGAGAPEIHDVTTDPADPPGFSTLTLPADNLRGVGTVARWRELHDQAYGDIRPLALPLAPAQAIARAERIARAKGWRIAAADPVAGRLEATDSVSLIGFQDDIVVLARPAPGGGSTVHARSVSRIGISDVGVNARRLREFLSDMAK